MVLGYQLNTITISTRPGLVWSSHYSSGAADAFDEKKGTPVTVKCSLDLSMIIQDSVEMIKKRFHKGKVEVTPSAYDTAWVAMVPSREYSGSRNKPCFPHCLDWIMENQNPDGSWGLDPGHPSLVKDSLSCTLACLLALRKWNIGEPYILKGLDYIGSNGWAISDKDQVSPIGFDIIFPGMINSARGMGLMLPNPTMMDSLIDSRYESVLGKNDHTGRNQIVGYVAEGLGQSCNWTELLSSHQRSNGSLFNSPATTAAALVHCHDDKCLDYLLSILEIHKTWVPTVHPIDIYAQLGMIDTLQRLGIHRHFEHEIASVLDQTYRHWQQKDEEIFSDVTCLAMAFRLLRLQGYEVSSDELAAFSEQENFFNRTSIQFTGIPTILELYRASEVAINEEENVLDKIQYWTTRFLKQNLLHHSIPNKTLHKQVEYAMETFYGTLDRVENRRSIELYNTNIFRMSKTAYRSPTLIEHESFLLLAQKDFIMGQAQQMKELEKLQRWFSDSRLDELKFGRDTLHVSHFITSSVLAAPQLSDARISYTKAIVLTTYVDDFFDKHASRMELLDLIEFIRKWDEVPTTGYRTKELEILFTTVYNDVNELASKGFITQGRNVKEFLVSLWLNWVKSQQKQVDWTTNGIIPSMEEHLSNACVTVACGICILTPLLLFGPKLDEELLSSTECNRLLYHASLVVRLLNDLQTFKREKEGSERVINSLNFLVARGEGAIEEDEAIATVNEMIKNSTRKLLKMVVSNDGSEFPRECKNLFWNSARIAYYLYCQSDGFTNPREKFMRDMKIVMYEPLNSC